MARRHRGKRPTTKAARQQELYRQFGLLDGLTIRVDGPQGCGKSTALTAIRLLLQDAGAEVKCFVDPRWPADGEANALTAQTNPEVLRELRDWIKDEPA